LKTIPLLFPITVGVKSDMAISSPVFCLDSDGESFAEALEDLAYRAFVLGRKRFRK
jgi:hypothetical protein